MDGFYRLMVMVMAMVPFVQSGPVKLALLLCQVANYGFLYSTQTHNTVAMSYDYDYDYDGDLGETQNTAPNAQWNLGMENGE